jgi:hypothetical protein
MSFKTHVFISYAHADNLEAGGPGWVTQFHEILEPLLTSRLKRTKAMIWRDKRLSDNDDFDPVIMKQLPDTAVFVAVLTDNYVDSDWCRREAQAFCDLATKGVGLAPEDKQRLFKIVKLPPEQQDTLPAPMQKTLGTPFFVRVDKDRRVSKDEHDRPLELDPSFGEEYRSRFRQQIALLAQDIAFTLKVLDASSAPGVSLAAVAASAMKPTVYLAECGEDRRSDREDLRSELVQRGYPVLPDSELPRGEADLRAEVARMLERSALSVHLLGASPGAVPDGEGEDSVVVIQNALSVERARAAPLRRVVSLPADTVSKRPRHQQFLDAMHREANIQGDAELITSDLEAVKAAMHAALKQIEAPPPPPVTEVAPTPGAAVQALKLYVIFDKPDLPATGDLRDALGEHFKVLKPIFEGTPEAKREADKQRLTECDAVLVYYGAGTDGWMDSVLSEVEQAVAWRAGRPFRQVYQWVAGPPTDDKLDKLRKPRPNVINALEGVSTGLLEPVIKTLRGGQP